MNASTAHPAIGRAGSPPWTTAKAMANWISLILAPPFCALLGVVLAAGQFEEPNLWLAAARYASLAVLAPTAYVAYLFRRRRIEDLHTNRRRERIKPLAVTLAGSVAGPALVAGCGLPGLFVAVATAQAAQTALFLVVTTRWKISAHGVAAADLAVLVWRLFGGAALPLLIWLPTVTWARIRLQRHTPSQVGAGAALGAAVWGFYLFT